MLTRPTRALPLPPPEKLCSDCGGKLTCSLEQLPLGTDCGLLGALFHLEYVVDLFSCPNCGKVALYTAHFGLDRKQKEEEANYVTCPACETRHRPLIGCPRCALHGRSAMPTAPKTEKTEKAPWEQKRRKLPWER